MQYNSEFINPAFSADLKAIRIIPGTKVTHDRQGDVEKYFPYKELLAHRIPAAIPAKPNGIVIIDIDVPGATHKHDGTIWWRSFVEEHKIPATYTVATPSGGFHFYYRLPDYALQTFRAPGALALGVDIKWDGYGICPPTEGYHAIYGDPYNMTICPPALLVEMEKKRNETGNTHEVPASAVGIRRAFSDEQITMLKQQLSWMQQNAVLTRDQWRDGIFSIKAGAFDRPDVAEELAVQWSYNKSYTPGDEAACIEVLAKADPYGPIGPGTIFSIIQEVMKAQGHEIQSKALGVSLFDISTEHGLRVDYDGKGRAKIEASESNVSTIVGSIISPADLFYDVRQDLYMFRGQPCEESQIVNSLIPALQHPTAGLGLEKFRKSVIQAGVETLLHHRQVDPHKEFLQKVEWDGVSRLHTFFADYFGVEQNEYHMRLGKNFWTALAARGLNPGCKFDSVLILEGGEGIRKSSFVEFIGGAYTYVPSEDHPFKSLDCLRQMHQAVVVELPELIGLIGESDEVVKARLAQPFDNIRSLYARKAMKRMRGFVFVGTTNSYVYLNQGVGVRRFWPLSIPSSQKALDLDAMAKIRDQLFAEGKALYKSNYDFWYMPDDLLTPVVRKRQHGQGFNNYLQEVVSQWGTFTLLQTYHELSKVGLVPKRLSTSVEQRIRQGLEELGYHEEAFHGKIHWKRKIEDQTKVFELFNGLL